MTDNAANVSAAPPTPRLASIDLFRAITILMMVFNALLSERSFKISNAPSWLLHASPPIGMTVIDVIFPFFIFLVGMSIPLAINRRLKKTGSQARLWLHILIRAASLMVIGKLMANAWIFADRGSPIGISMDLWGVLLFLSFFLIWIRHPESQGSKRGLFITLRCAGAVLLLYLLVIFRQGDDGKWLLFDVGGPYAWWILGIIGWAYLVSCVIYVVFRRRIEGVIGCLGLFVLVYIAGITKVFMVNFPYLTPVMHYVNFYTLLGSYPSIATAGVVVTMFYTDVSAAQTTARRIGSILVFGTGLAIAGFLLSAFGISSAEGRATPTWALYSSAISCAVFAFLHWLVEARRKDRWVTSLLPLGANALFVYLLSRMIYPLFGLLQINFLNTYFDSGMPGIIRAAIYTFLLMIASAFLITRCRITLRL
jgi:predicted acyltransferase